MSSLSIGDSEMHPIDPASLPRVSQSPTDQAFVQNPYGAYREWRAMGEFVFWEEFEMAMATTHESVRAILTSKSMGREIPPEKSAPVQPGLAPFYDLEANSMLELEPPRHTRLRGLVLRAFTRNRILHLAPEISMISDTLVSSFPDGPFDLLETFAQHLPVIIIARLLGVPDTMAPQLLTWSNAMVSMYQSRRTPEIERAAARASSEFAAFIREHIDAKRKAPGNDLMSELISTEEMGEQLTNDELVSTCILLLNAGHEATVHSLGNATRHLLGLTDREAMLHPEHIANTVEECLRYDPPLHLFTRHVYEDTVLRDHSFEAGQEIGCLLGSACHDDAIWPDAETFDPTRDVRPHMAFGAGIHFCVGAPLARLEMQVALPLLFASCPNLRLVEQPTVANLYHFRGLEELMVRVD